MKKPKNKLKVFVSRARFLVIETEQGENGARYGVEFCPGGIEEVEWNINEENLERMMCVAEAVKTKKGYLITALEKKTITPNREREEI